MTVKFGAGSKVFAKVRGYPWWPARIDGCADETPNKVKYHVYFYGTGETAVIKSTDVCDYVENKSKLGFVKKTKNFAEAIADCEEHLTPEQRSALAQVADRSAVSSPAVKEPADTPKADKAAPSTPAEGGAEPKRRPSAASKTPKTAAVQQTPVKAQKRKADSEPEDSAVKKPNASPPPEKAAEPTSRSGRKIKPKSKFDDDDVKEEADSAKTPSDKKDDDKKKKLPLPTVKRKTKDDGDKSDDTSDDGSSYLYATRGKDKIKIPLQLNRPNFEDKKKRSVTLSRWETLVLDEARELKKSFEAGDKITDESAHEHMDRFTKVKAANVHEIRSPEEEAKHKKRVLDVEYVLVDADVRIRNALSLTNANPKKCLEQLDRIKQAPITALMLKKQPQILRTLRKLKKYVGNATSWNMTAEEIAEFDAQTEIIRTKAKEVINSFKTLFFMSSGVSFWDHFSRELADFNCKTKHMTVEEVFSIISDFE
ncbi:Lens epithelium-derived growth factor (LEDGF) [Nesidiocoris tenuis]|uniref:Lens epithelium-derived growth factor (LEDGF) n=1 Tax=Nesidiocoris tenuis TaxID=355587 RepID=A0ABN7AXT5_9HEMI|nr:Lens epithelium-derived growth factor (LEDGF) [Nesidiocoris tenuis]